MPESSLAVKGQTKAKRGKRAGKKQRCCVEVHTVIHASLGRQRRSASAAAIRHSSMPDAVTRTPDAARVSACCVEAAGSDAEQCWAHRLVCAHMMMTHTHVLAITTEKKHKHTH